MPTGPLRAGYRPVASAPQVRTHDGCDRGPENATEVTFVPNISAVAVEAAADDPAGNRHLSGG